MTHSDQRGFKKVLGRIDAIALGFGAMIGFGWVVLTGGWLDDAGTAGAALAMVAGGAIMAAVGVLQSNLGFDADQVALMIAAYIAIDSFGTAANVTGDGAIAMVVNKLSKGRLRTEQDGDGIETEGMLNTSED